MNRIAITFVWYVIIAILLIAVIIAMLLIVIVWYVLCRNALQLHMQCTIIYAYYDVSMSYTHV